LAFGLIKWNRKTEIPYTGKPGRPARPGVRELFFDFFSGPGRSGPVRVIPGTKKNNFSQNQKKNHKNSPEPGLGSSKPPEKHVGITLVFFLSICFDLFLTFSDKTLYKPSF